MSDISTISTSWTRLKGSAQYILATNDIRLDAEWKEETANGKNRIHVRFYVCSKYRINGTWSCSFKINGTTVLNRQSTVLNQGNNTNAWATQVLVGERYLDLDKTNKSTSINLYIHDFDYLSVTTGAWTKKDFTQAFTISLTNTDSNTGPDTETEIIPSNPTIAINNPVDGQGRNTYEVLQLNGNGIAGGFRVYPCKAAVGSNNDNKLVFYVPMPTNGSKIKVRIGKYINGQGWNDNYYDSGWSTAPTIEYVKAFYSTDRYDKGVAWKAWSIVKSSTGQEKISDTIWFVFNDQPYFADNQPNISCNSIVIPGTTNLQVSWDSCINSLYQSVYTLRYKLSSNSTWKEVYTSNATSTTIDLSAYTRGSTIEFQVKAEDKYDTDIFRGSATVKINTLPTLSSNIILNNMNDPNTYNNHYDKNVIFTLPDKNDIDGQLTFYKIDYKIDNNNWTSYNSHYTGSTALSINCSNYQNTAGGTFQLRVTVNDGLEDGDIATSAILTKNTKPATPSGISYTPTNSIHANSHAEEITNIAWKSINNVCNGRPVPKYEIIQKTATTLSANGTNKSTYNSITNNIATTVSDITRGEYFWFEIVAVDIFGYKSDTYITTRYRRNQIPSSPSQIVLNQQKLNVYKNVPLTWGDSIDPDGDTVKYKLEVKKGTLEYEIVSNTITANSYNHNITGYTEGLPLKYRITPYDDHNVYGQSVETTQNIVVNTRPLGIDIVYPINCIYNTQPRILFNVLNDIDGDDLTLTININGIDYVSNLHNDYFSKSVYRPVTKGVFKGPRLHIGENIIKTKSHDGYQYSDEKTFTIVINNSLLQDIDTGYIILSEHMNGLNTMINDYYTAYGCVFNKKDSLITAGSIIKSTTMNNMYDNIIAINNTINNFSDDTVFDKTIIQNTISSGMSIKKEINDINHILKNL